MLRLSLFGQSSCHREKRNAELFFNGIKGNQLLLFQKLFLQIQQNTIKNQHIPRFNYTQVS